MATPPINRSPIRRIAQLRPLELKDAPFMLEWMHDSSVVEFLQTNFAVFNLDDCKAFITASWTDTRNFHLAITDMDDIYMGTVSLKNINKNMAEFAITIRKTAMGHGYSQYAMKEMLRIGKEHLHLDFIYWCVSPQNQRAIRFYDKSGYKKLHDTWYCNYGTETDFIKGYTISQLQKYIWYMTD